MSFIKPQSARFIHKVLTELIEDWDNGKNNPDFDIDPDEPVTVVTHDDEGYYVMSAGGDLDIPGLVITLLPTKEYTMKRMRYSRVLGNQS
jgi:hypothetical protein